MLWSWGIVVRETKVSTEVVDIKDTNIDINGFQLIVELIYSRLQGGTS